MWLPLRTLSSLVAVVLTLGPAVSSEAGSRLKLTDATFTDDVVNLQPRKRLTSFSLGDRGRDARLWFWFRVQCGDVCRDEERHNPQIPIVVKWALQEEGKYIVKVTVPLKVQGANWRSWAYKRNLKPGKWLVAVFGDEGVLCLDNQCGFSVEVTP